MKFKSLLLLTATLFSASAFADNEEGINIPARGVDFYSAGVDSVTSTVPWKARVQKAVAKFDPTLKFGGYIMGKYSVSDQKKVASNGGFDLRFVRLYANGYVWHDFYYRFQLEVNGAPGVDKGPRIVDAFVEYQKWNFLRIKFGQFKRSWGFENPMAPHAVGLGTFSQIAMQFAIADRCGEHKASGRDVGLQLQGDLLKGRDGHEWLHYQVGFFNGQGINHTDKDNFKDLIGGLWIMPIKNLQIGGFGWNGKYTNESFSNPLTQRKSVTRNRWGVGVNYNAKWVVRSEYQKSYGGVTSDINKATRSDGWYITVGVPVLKDLKIYGRWDCYRDNARTWDSLKTDWGIAANYFLGKNLIFQANYYYTDDRASRTPGKDSHYGKFDFQLTAKF